MELGNIVEKIFKQELKSEVLASKILSGETKLVEVVEGLGPKLTSTDVQDRMFATEILADVFDALPKDFLNKEELGFIVEFLLNRLKDQHLVVPKAILCVLPIMQCSNLPDGSGALLLNQIFSEANVQSHVHKIRKTVFVIIDYMIRNKTKELKEMSTDFVVNFLQAIDGEKDPRNLLLLFQLIPKVISSFDLGPFIEDFYEVLACYFPIDFTPSYSVPGSELITRESLADALHVCLSQTPKFSEFLIPLTLEKLDSSLPEAKVDSLRLLELCCERCYSASNLEPFLSQIWHSLRREIFMGGNETVEKHSMDFLQSAFRVISTDENVLNTCIEMVFVECKHHLCEPGLRLIQPTSKILVSMCNASEATCKNVCPKVLSVIRDQLTHNVVGNEEKKRLLGITQLVVASTREYTQLTLSDLLPDWDQIVATWFTYLTSDDKEYTTLCLKIFLILLDKERDFPQERRKLLQEHILALVENGLSSADTISAIIAVAEKITSMYEEDFIVTSVPLLLKWADPNVMSIEGNDIGRNNEKRTLSLKLLGECSGNGALVFENVVAYLLNLISQNHHDQPALQCLELIVDKVTAVENKLSSSISLLVEKLLVLDKIFQVGLDLYLRELQAGLSANDTSSNAASCVKDNCCRRQEIGSQQVSCGKPIQSTATDEFNLCTKIIRNIIRCSDIDRQTQIEKKFWELTVNENPLELCLTNTPLALIEAVLASLRQPVKIHRQYELVEYLLEKQVSHSQQLPKSWSDRESLVKNRLLGVLLNKTEPESEFSRTLATVEAHIHNGFKSNNITLPTDDQTSEKMELVPMEIQMDEKQNLDRLSVLRECIELLAWVTKALAMRGIKNLNNWIDKIIFLLMREDVGSIAAKGFNTLLADDPVSLNCESHIKFRFLYKQRIFQASVPKLVKGYREAESVSSKINFIQALSSQLKFIPKEILAMSIDSVFPLLVASLKFDSSGAVLLSTLNAFTEMMNNSDDETDKMLVEYFHDIVPELVRLAGFPGNIDVRMKSLKCLRRFAKSPLHVITPLREKVVDNLKATLDDKKRLVRKEAYQTRNVWILIGSPGGL